MKHRFVALLFIILLLGLVGVVGAQDTRPEPTLPAEFPIDVPTEAPTDVPTDIPTEAPTDIPTEVPTDTPTDTPTEVPTDAPTEEPSAPPVFSLASGTAFSVVAGTALNFDVSVADEAGVVRIVASPSAAGFPVIVTSGSPAETAAPFNTPATVTYTAAAEFSGADSFTLTAVDSAGTSVSITILVNVEALPATIAPTEDPAGLPSHELVIKYDPAASEDAIATLLREMNAVEVQRIPQIGAMRILVQDSLADASVASNAFLTTAAAQAVGLSAIEENYERVAFQDTSADDVGAQYVPADPRWGDLWGLKNTTAGAWVQRAWDHSATRGSGVIVAVIDTGIDATHPDLAGQIAPGGWDFVNDDNNPADDHIHGTHVAGTIAARMNAVGVIGAAYNAKILPIKVLNNGGSGNIFNTAMGIIYAVDKGAKIINMSLGGGPFSYSEQGAVNYALYRGVTVIASAGNTGTNIYNYPASYDGVISVAAHDINANTAIFSTFNNRVTISAPGVSILSTTPMIQTNYMVSNLLAAQYEYLNGTSMAAPHVAGVAALLYSAGVAKTPETIKEALICGARDENAGAPENLPGYDNYMGWGVLDADYALKWRYNDPNCQVPQPNDHFANATNIPSVPFSLTQAVSNRSVTSQVGDPVTCGASPDQTLWYKYKPTVSGYYQFSTIGSSFDTVIGVYRGNTHGALQSVGCNDQLGLPGVNQSLVGAALTAGQDYYIVVDGFGSGWTDQVLQLQVRPAIEALNVDVQNTATQIGYYGMWTTTALPSASGGSYHQTTDNDAYAAFVFVGTGFDLYRVVGPTQGDLEVWVDGALYGTYSGRGAITTGNQALLFGVSAGYNGVHTVVLRRAAGGLPGPISLDRVRIFNTATGVNAITGLTDDRDATRIKYWGGTWLTGTVVGAHLNTVTYSTTNGAYAAFRARGGTIIVHRTTAGGYGSANVYVDGTFWGTMVNNSATGVKQPYVISGLSNSEHTVEIVNNAASTLEIDSVQAVATTAIAAKTDERAATIYYTGNWTSYNVPGLYLNTARYTLDSSARINFWFTGNYLCLGYAAQSGGGSFNIYVDNLLVDTVNTANASYVIRTWCSHTSPTAIAGRQVYFAGQHAVRIERAAAGWLEFDWFQPYIYNILTPARGLVQQTDLAITYSGTWVTATGATVGPNTASVAIPTGAKSAGGSLPQGGSLLRSNIDGSSATFFINGTGFVLYSASGPAMGCAQVYVDNSLYTFQVGSTFYNGLDLYVPTPNRYRPFAWGIYDLVPGVHKVQIYVDSNCSSLGLAFSPIFYFDLDAVRVFP